MSDGVNRQTNRPLAGKKGIMKNLDRILTLREFAHSAANAIHYADTGTFLDSLRRAAGKGSYWMSRADWELERLALALQSSD